MENIWQLLFTSYMDIWLHCQWNWEEPKHKRENSKNNKWSVCTYEMHWNRSIDKNQCYKHGSSLTLNVLLDFSIFRVVDLLQKVYLSWNEFQFKITHTILMRMSSLYKFLWKSPRSSRKSIYMYGTSKLFAMSWFDRMAFWHNFLNQFQLQLMIAKVFFN